MTLPARLQQRGIFYGWIIVFVCFVVIALVFGVRLSFGIFFEALTRNAPGQISEFDWTRADTAAVFSVTMIVFALTSTFIGWTLDRWGARRVFTLGLLIMALGLFLTGRMTGLLQFHLFYGIWTGVGITILGLTMQAATLSRWFDRLGRRGLAIGLAFSGTGIGILILAPTIEQIISRYGWRNAYTFLAGLLICVGLPLVLLLLRDSPAEVGLSADGAARHAAAFARRSPPARHPPASSALAQLEDLSPSWSFRQSLATPTFWLLMASGALSLFTLRMVSVHQVAHLVDQGFPRLTAAAVLGGAGLITAFSFILFGILSDRIGRPTAFQVGAVAQLLALTILIVLWPDAPPALLYVYVLLWGIGEGSRSGLLTALASDLFPGPALGAIVGTLGAFFGLGAALGSWLGGLAFDLGNSYTFAFKVAFIATVLATLCIFAIDKIGNRTRPNDVAVDVRPNA